MGQSTINAESKPLLAAGDARRHGWALGFLRGTVGAYARGSVPVATANGAVRLAQREQVPVHDITTILSACGLQWDADRDSVVPSNQRKRHS
jgi:hypothetical protein